MDARLEGRIKRKTPLAAAVCHPMRTRAFAVLAERIASPAELARELHGDVGNVNYHVRVLVEAGLVRQVDSRPVRGTTEHFFKAVELPQITEREEMELTPQVRRSFAETVVAMFAANFSRAIETETYLTRKDNHLTRRAINVDGEGWEELTGAYMDLYERVAEIEATAAERMAETDQKPVRVVSFQALFEIPMTAK